MLWNDIILFNWNFFNFVDVFLGTMVFTKYTVGKTNGIFIIMIKFYINILIIYI
jgi:hypothetical protein